MLRPIPQRENANPANAAIPSNLSAPQSMISAEQHNQRAWDNLARQGSGFARPATDEDFRRPERVINPFGWIPGTVAGKQVLCLAAGGGRHGPIFADQQADVTVVDLSEAMLRLDREVARRKKVILKTIKTSMNNLIALGNGIFDIVLQPVSACYVEDIRAVYREVERVIKTGGIYISQHKQPISLQASAKPSANGAYSIQEPYYRSGPLPPITNSEHRETNTKEFLHTLESILGGMCAQGFVINDVKEPRHANPLAPPGSFQDRSRYVPPYIAVKATLATPNTPRSPLWTPG